MIPCLDIKSDLFPVQKNYIYLNHAATAPYSRLTADAMRGYIEDMTCSGGQNFKKWNQVREETRDLAAKLLNCSSHEIALLGNTSEGANLVAQGLDFVEGDNIVIPGREFPANYYPWANLVEKGIQLKEVPPLDGKTKVRNLMSKINDRTKLVAVSSVAYYNGFRLDIESLGRELDARGIFLYVDAIQSLGVIPLDVRRSKVSYLSADGHKWLLAPEGAAIFFCAKEKLSTLKQVYLSWLSVENPFQFDDLHQKLAQGSTRFEYGTPNLIGTVGLNQSLKLLLETGIDRIMEKVMALTAMAREGLIKKGYSIHSPWGKQERSGILCFSHPLTPPNKLAEILEQAGVIVTIRGGGIRISPHFYNTQEEIDRFLAVLP